MQDGLAGAGIGPGTAAGSTCCPASWRKGHLAQLQLDQCGCWVRHGCLEGPTVWEGHRCLPSCRDKLHCLISVGCGSGMAVWRGPQLQGGAPLPGRVEVQPAPVDHVNPFHMNLSCVCLCRQAS